MSQIDKKTFKRALGSFASGVTVVTVRTPDGDDHGMTANAFSSVSMDPPLILVCIQNKNQTFDLISKAGAFAVNILARDQEERSNRFAGGIVDAEGRWQRWPEDRSRFADLIHTRAEASGAMFLTGSLASIDCTLEAVHPGGDHGIFVGRIQEITLTDESAGEPLLYFGGRYGDFATE